MYLIKHSRTVFFFLVKGDMPSVFYLIYLKNKGHLSLLLRSIFMV